MVAVVCDFRSFSNHEFLKLLSKWLFFNLKMKEALIDCTLNFELLTTCQMPWCPLKSFPEKQPTCVNDPELRKRSELMEKSKVSATSEILKCENWITALQWSPSWSLFFVRNQIYGNYQGKQMPLKKYKKKICFRNVSSMCKNINEKEIRVGLKRKKIENI